MCGQPHTLELSRRKGNECQISLITLFYICDQLVQRVKHYKFCKLDLSPPVWMCSVGCRRGRMVKWTDCVCWLSGMMSLAAFILTSLLSVLLIDLSPVCVLCHAVHKHLSPPFFIFLSCIWVNNEVHSSHFFFFCVWAGFFFFFFFFSVVTLLHPSPPATCGGLDAAP